MSVLNIGFSQYSDGDFLLKGRMIASELSSLPGSTYFPTSATLVNDLVNQLDLFQEAVEEENAPGAKEDRHAQRTATVVLLTELAALLESVSLDRDKLAHTGYGLRKEPQPDPTPTGKPQDVKAKATGITGEARLTCRGVANVLTYEYEWSLDPNAGPWHTVAIVSNVRDLLVTGLERGKDTWFRIRAFGRNGTGPWSDPAMMMVV